MYYRLDPGEPGLLRNARASESVRKVSQQEQRNLLRLKTQASREGRRVIRSGISYLFGIDGSFSSLRAGKTTVVSKSIEKKDVVQIKELRDENDDQKETGFSELQKESDSENDHKLLNSPDSNDNKSDEELAQEINFLRMKKNQLEGELKKSDISYETGLLLSSEHKDSSVSKDLKKISAELKKLEVEQVTRQIEKSEENLTGALQKSYEQTEKMFNAIIGGVNNKANFAYSRPPDTGIGNYFQLYV